MEEKDLMFAIFGVVEDVTKAELTNIAKTLIYNYYKSSEQSATIERAREAVLRYTQCKSLPALADIQKKTKFQLNKLEHLILRLEYEAKRADGTLAPAPEPEPEPEAESFSPPPPSPQTGSGPFRVEQAAHTRSAAAAPGIASPVRKSRLTSGSFSGVKVKRQPSPPIGKAKPKASAKGNLAKAKKPKAAATRGASGKTKPAARRQAAKKTGGRKKSSR